LALGIEQLDDFIQAYLQRYVMGKWQDISLPLQQYKFASRLFDRAKKDEMSTAYCKWKLKVRNNDNFQVVGLYHRDSSNRVNMLTEASMKWAMTTTNYHYDIDEEVFGQGAKQIIDYMKLQEDGLMVDFFTGMEDIMFGEGPTDPAQNPFPPCSLLWWITADATEGFNGAEPSGFESVGVGNIKTSDYPAWKNRTFSYTQVSQEDFVAKVIRSMDKCMFEPPIAFPDIVSQNRPNWELLTTYSRIERCRELQRLQNDNIGKDLGEYAGSVYIRNVPMVNVPAWTNIESINARTDGIILGVNWATFKWYYQSGRNMRKRKPFQHKDMSNVRVRAMDDSGQIVCFNRRGNFRGYSTEAVAEAA